MGGVNTHKYQPPDEIVWLNKDDPNLVPIPVNQLDIIRRTYRFYGATEPTDWPEPELVSGYGLRPEEQKFTKEVTPRGLVELERTIRYDLKPKGKGTNLSGVRRELAVIETFWNTLEQQHRKYEEEINWLRQCWYYRLFGKHLYINGKHTYITGENWFFLNYWVLNGINTTPEYRDVARR